VKHQPDPGRKGGRLEFRERPGYPDSTKMIQDCVIVEQLLGLLCGDEQGWGTTGERDGADLKGASRYRQEGERCSRNQGKDDP